LFGDGAFGQLTEDGKLKELVLRDLDNHPDPCDEDNRLACGNQRMKSRYPAFLGQRFKHPIHNQPGDEEIKSLKGVEASVPIFAKFGGGQNNNGRDPSYSRYIAKDGSEARVEIAQEVMRGRRRGSGCGSGRWLDALLCAADGTKLVMISDSIPTLRTERHRSVSIDDTRKDAARFGLNQFDGKRRSASPWNRCCW